MSIRIGEQLIANSVVIGVSGLGVIAEDIPTTGVDGSGILHRTLDLPTDNGKEVRALLVTPPTNGDFSLYEDGAFTFKNAPDGNYNFTFDLYHDGVKVGDTKLVLLSII